MKFLQVRVMYDKNENISNKYGKKMTVFFLLLTEYLYVKQVKFIKTIQVKGKQYKKFV